MVGKTPFVAGTRRSGDIVTEQVHSVEVLGESSKSGETQLGGSNAVTGARRRPRLEERRATDPLT